MSLVSVGRCDSDRPSRSCFHTTRQSPDRRKASGEYSGKTGSAVTAAAGTILEQVPRVGAGRQQRIALEIEHLTAALGGNPHVTDQYVPKAPFLGIFGTIGHSDSACRSKSRSVRNFGLRP